MDTSEETRMDAEFCTCVEMTAVVCVTDTGKTVLVEATDDTEVAVEVDTWVVAQFVVATDVSGDDVVVTVSGADAAHVDVVTWDKVLPVFSAGVEEVQVSTLEGAAAATGVVAFISPVGCDKIAATVFASTGVATLAGEEVHMGLGVAADVAEVT